ncbi:MAG: hypothetical protein WKF47_06365 [Geodermatophilaceae bacterium]
MLGQSDDLARIIRERGVTQVIMLEFPLFTEINREIIQVCDQLGGAAPHRERSRGKTTSSR